MSPFFPIWVFSSVSISTRQAIHTQKVTQSKHDEGDPDLWLEIQSQDRMTMPAGLKVSKSVRTKTAGTLAGVLPASGVINDLCFVSYCVSVFSLFFFSHK